MNSAEAIEFLRQHQPMPPEGEIDGKLIQKYDAARVALQLDPNPAGLDLLLGSFGPGSGLGVYQLVEDTLAAYGRSDVVDALVRALNSPAASVRSWCMEIALSYPDPRLKSSAARLIHDDDRDVRFFAASYLADVAQADPTLLTDIARASRMELDDEVRDVLQEALDRHSDIGPADAESTHRDRPGWD